MLISSELGILKEVFLRKIKGGCITEWDNWGEGGEGG
jgi:hypothetical protein